MMDWATRISEKHKNWFCVAALIGIIVIRFYKTIFFGQSISKVFLLAHWDSLFYSLKSGKGFGMDPSCIAQFMPSRFLVANYWYHGLPLWNAWSGFGMPLLADPQAFVFSPTSIFYALIPDIYSRNMVLIIKLAIAAICTYLLSRELKLNFVAGLIAALLFTFCPWLHWQLELLGKGTCFAPLVFLFFTRLAKKGSPRSIILAGVIAALEVLSCHPEIAFATLLSATIFACPVAYCYNPSKRSFAAAIGSLLPRILLAGLIAFGICAPMLIPFLEYITHADSYKLKAVASAGLSWQAVLANFLFPFQGSKGSLFFGPLSWWGVLAVLCFFKHSNKFAKPLIIGLFISLLCVIRPFPFELLFKIPPLSMTFATYWLPEYFLFISIVSGLGCSYLIDHGLKKSSSKTWIFLAAGIALLIIPLVCLPWQYDSAAIVFDQTFAPPQFNLRVWLFNSSCALAALAILIITINKSQKWKIFGAATFVLIGLSNLMITSWNSLPIRPYFEYPQKLALNLNSGNIAKTDRILTIGDHLFRPNTNIVYQLPQLQVLNPIFPKGFIEFSKACGAQVDQYSQVYPPIINPLLRLAGINKILSEQPILDGALIEELFPINPKTNNKNILTIPSVDYANLLSLTDIHLLHDPKAGSLFCLTKATPHIQNTAHYHLLMSIEDTNGNSVVFIEPQLICASTGPQEILCSGLIPKDLKRWSASIRMLQDKDCTFLSPVLSSQNTVFDKVRADNSYLLATSNERKYFTEINNSQFKLIAHDGSILLYEDHNAFSRYFFVSKVAWVKGQQEALDYLKAHTNELHDVTVLEETQREDFKKVIEEIESNTPVTDHSSLTSFDQSATVKRIDADDKDSVFRSATDFSLQVESKCPSLLIASDIYYPGWKVYLDGKRWKMFRADYLFRGVILPAGKHIVRFAYQPISLIIGVLFFFITIGSLLIISHRNKSVS